MTPAPAELVTFLLSERDNPHSPRRANGRRFWGYPERVGGLDAITCIGIHTTENNPSPGVALNVGRWQATTAPAPSSYHVLVDSDHIVRTLDDAAVAFHTVGLNTRALGLSFGHRHDWWGRYPVYDDEALDNGAWQAALWCHAYDIPRRWLTQREAAAGVRGFIRHSTADPSRRRDPGRTFPDGPFMRRVEEFLSRRRPPATPRTLLEEIAAMTDAERRALVDEIATAAATKVLAYKGAGQDRDVYHHIVTGARDASRAAAGANHAQIARRSLRAVARKLGIPTSGEEPEQVA